MNNSLLERRINDSNNSKSESGCYSELEKIIFYDLVYIGNLLLRIKYDIAEYNNGKLKKTFFLLCEEFDFLLDDIDKISKRSLKKNYSIYKNNPIMNLYFTIFSIEQICLTCSDKIKNKEQFYKDLKNIKNMILLNDTNVRIIAKAIEDLDDKYGLLKMKYIKRDPIKSSQNEIYDNYESKISSEGKEYVIGDGLIDYLDDFIAGLPLPVLQKASADNIINGRENRIIEKAIKNKKEKTKEMKRRKRKEVIDNFFHSFTIFGEILSIFSSDSKKLNNNYSSLEQEEILKGNYEPYQFEEEDLEEDDYYFEDDLD